MRNQSIEQNPATGHGNHSALFGVLVAGVGIGAALSLLWAPKSGAETRKWIAGRCLDGAEAANTKVQQARFRMNAIADQGQAKVTAAVAAGREALGLAPEETAEKAA